jgi:hypothetical protein
LQFEEYRTFGIDFGGLGYAGNVCGEPRSFGIDLNLLDAAFTWSSQDAGKKWFVCR